MDNLRYFRFVGDSGQASLYSSPCPINGVVYPHDCRMGMGSVIDYAIGITLPHYNRQWQEVYVSDVEVVPQKTFPPDPVTLDTYVGAKWYDVREVLPDERFDDRLYVLLRCKAVRHAVWDNEDEKFISIAGDILDHVVQWRANKLM